MSLVNDISQTGMRIGGTSEQQVGEGRADAPVGTTLAMIEQATKKHSLPSAAKWCWHRAFSCGSHCNAAPFQWLPNQTHCVT
jgi:hypothetical protein